MSNDKIYFGNKEGKETAGILLEKADTWMNHLRSVGLRQKLQDMWRAYHGAYYASAGNGHMITFSGEQGELANLAVNHFRNIAQHMLTMTTANRPMMEARASNSDVKSLIQTTLANNILDYYMREKRLEEYLKLAVEYAIVLGAGYIKMDWNATTGNVYDVIENEDGTKTPLYDGDIEFSNFSPIDVLIDSSKEGNDHDWYLVRTYKNKFDLAAKYPEYGDKIRGLKTKSDTERFKFGIINIHEETDDIYVFEFYHKRTESMPNGRYLMFLDDEIILQDRDLPYRILPIFRIAPGNILGTPYGYSPMFDLLPLQESINSLYSTVLTNQSTFGVQNIWIKRGSDIHVNALAGGLNVIESLEKPESLNLTNTPGEIFKFVQMLEQAMETVSGVNSVSRGNPEASLKSGTALALVQSMSLQFISGLQASYVRLIEDVGTGIIKFLQDFASSPRLVAIVGKNNRTEMKEFTGEEVSAISRVVVDVGNPLARTTAGRVQMADNLLQYLGKEGKISSSEYINLINTGRLDVMTDDVQHESWLIKAENEKMMDGEAVTAIFVDDHKEHISSHKRVLADPELRKDANLIMLVGTHINEHIDLLRNTDPDTLLMLGQQPLQPKQPMGGQPGGQGVPIPPEEFAQNPQTPPTQGLQGLQSESGEVQGPGIETGVKLPSMPKVPGDLLVNQQIQDQSMGNVK